MENIVYSALGKLFTILFFLVDAVSAIDICYETSRYQYYCEEGTECCKSNTACCDITDSTDGDLSTGAIVGIIFGCAFVVAALIIFCSCISKGTPVGTDGEAGTTTGTSSQDNNVREDELQACCIGLMELLCCETRTGRPLFANSNGGNCSSSQDNNVQENQLREQLPRRIQTVQITAAQRAVNGSATALANDRVVEEPYNTRFDNYRHSDLLHV